MEDANEMEDSGTQFEKMKLVFDSIDTESTGLIEKSRATDLLNSLDFDQVTNGKIIEKVNIIESDTLSYEDLENIIISTQSIESSSALVVLEENPEEKVVEFLKILNEYRKKCEEEGNYNEAGRAYKQLNLLRKQEEKRQQRAVLSKQESEKLEMQKTHTQQFEDFNKAWDKYLDEYDTMAQQYIISMTERHQTALMTLQNKLRDEMIAKPPKWSKELLEQRRKQHLSAKNRNYKEAQELKKLCDEIEARELNTIETDHNVIFARKEGKFRQQQQAELQALLKRIECRRKEHMKQRNTDSKRLIQRNKNVQTALENKQHLEAQKQFEVIKKKLSQITMTEHSNGSTLMEKKRVMTSESGTSTTTKILPTSPHSNNTTITTVNRKSSGNNSNFHTNNTNGNTANHPLSIPKINTIASTVPSTYPCKTTSSSSSSAAAVVSTSTTMSPLEKINGITTTMTSSLSSNNSNNNSQNGDIFISQPPSYDQQQYSNRNDINGNFLDAPFLNSNGPSFTT